MYIPAFLFSVFIVPKREAAVVCTGRNDNQTLENMKESTKPISFHRVTFYESIFLCSVLLYFVCHVCRCLVVFIVLLVNVLSYISVRRPHIFSACICRQY